jgi:hypothetical protein
MIARMRALTDAGLSRSAVAKVVGLDFGIKPPHRRTVQGYAPLPKDSPKHAKRLTLRV